MNTRGASSTVAPKKNLFEGILGAIHGLAEVMREHITNKRQPRKRGNGNENHIIKQFQRMQPPEFRGTTNPMEVKSWTMQLDVIFEIIGCVDD